MRTVLAVGVLCSLALPCVAADPPAKTDRYGDPLPPGALMRLGTLRNRAPITGFGIEKDGTMVTVGPGMDLRRWNPVDDRSDEPIQLPLGGPEHIFNLPQVSPDGKFVAASSAVKVFVWEAPTDAKAKPKEVAAFEIGSAQLFRFSPDGAKLVVATVPGEPTSVSVCDIQTGKMTALKFTPGITRSANFSGDGKRVGVVADGEFYLFDAASGEQLAKYQPEGGIPLAFALDGAGGVVAGLTYPRDLRSEVRLTDALTGKKIGTLTGPAGAVEWVTFAADGKTLLVGDRAGIRWWDPAAGKLIRRFEGAVLEPAGLRGTPARLSADGKWLVASSGSALLRWDAATGKPLFPEQNIGHGGPVTGVRVSGDGKRIATHGADERVCVWDAATGKELWHAPAARWRTPKSAFSPDGKFLYAGAPDEGAVTKFDAATGTVVTKYVTDPNGPKHPCVDCVRVSGDGKTVFAATSPVLEIAARPGFVIAWDEATGERTRVTERPLLATHLSPGAEYVCATEWAGAVRVYKVGEPKKGLLVDFNFGRNTSGHFSDDGKWLTLINRERNNPGTKLSIIVVSTVDWKVTQTLSLDRSGHAALSPDGRTLAVLGGEKLEFFDTATARALSGLRVPTGDWERAISGSVVGLGFTPDGTKVITGHPDTTALVWPVPERPAK